MSSELIRPAFISFLAFLFATLCVGTDDPIPSEQCSRDLLAKWQENARLNGDIPGGTLQNLAQATDNFIFFNPNSKHVPALKTLRKRMDLSHDWTTKQAVELLNSVTERQK